jgi:hypothetical protein
MSGDCSRLLILWRMDVENQLRRSGQGKDVARSLSPLACSFAPGPLDTECSKEAIVLAACSPRTSDDGGPAQRSRRAAHPLHAPHARRLARRAGQALTGPPPALQGGGRSRSPAVGSSARGRGAFCTRPDPRRPLDAPWRNPERPRLRRFRRAKDVVGALELAQIAHAESNHCRAFAPSEGKSSRVDEHPGYAA